MENQTFSYDAVCEEISFVRQLSSDSLPSQDKSLEGDGRFYQPGPPGTGRCESMLHAASQLFSFIAYFNV
jgi:hypothetical protein